MLGVSSEWFCYIFRELLGCIFGGIAYDRLNRIALFVCVNVGESVAVCIAPWCTTFTSMLIAHVCIGIFGGFLKTGKNLCLVISMTCLEKNRNKCHCHPLFVEIPDATNSH